MTNDDETRAMLARIDERTKSTQDEVKRQSGDISGINKKLDEQFVRKDTHDAAVGGLKRWLNYVTGFVAAVATAAVGSYFKP